MVEPVTSERCAKNLEAASNLLRPGMCTTRVMTDELAPVGSRPPQRTSEDFADWARPYLPDMARLAARLAGPAERDDVCQEALARAWRKWHLFDESRGTARTWLLAIVASEARRSRVRFLSRPRPLVLAAADGVRIAAPDDSGVDLERALATLPPRMRLAVDCVYFVGLTNAEAAAVMGVSEGTVKSALHDARNRMRTLLEVTA